MVQTYANQLFHNTSEPLDATSQVEYFEDLSNTTKVIPYNGKIVHVKADKILYVCNKKADGSFIWSPLFKEDGTCLYLTSASGDVFSITCQRDGGNVGRLIVSYPLTFEHEERPSLED